MISRTVWASLLAFTAGVLAQAPNAPKPAPTTAQSIDRIEKQAQAARAANNVDEAIALYKKGVALKPNWDEGWWSVGTLNYEQDRFPEARDAFRRLASIKPDVAVPWAMLGLCQFETHQYDQALENLRHGIALGLGQGQSIADVANFHLALLLTRFEEYEASMKLLALSAI
jgi:tetratricopeptide (TPR) repeat protein